MIFKKRLNNNVVVAVDGKNNEMILMGRGLGFQIELGTRVDESRIEKRFCLADSKMNERFKELLQTIPMEHVQLADEVISYFKAQISGAINENVLIALCDHMYMAVERKKQGIEVRNALLWDIQKFYRKEYEAGRYAVRRIEEAFGTLLMDDEAGFIALHLVNAQLDLHTETVKKIIVVMQEIERIVRMTFSIPLDTDSVYYDRFISHLRFFAGRMFSGKIYDGQDVEELVDVVKKKHAAAYQCTLKIADFLKHRYGYALSEEEILYLGIHISRIVLVYHPTARDKAGK